MSPIRILVTILLTSKVIRKNILFHWKHCPPELSSFFWTGLWKHCEGYGYNISYLINKWTYLLRGRYLSPRWPALQNAIMGRFNIFATFSCISGISGVFFFCPSSVGQILPFVCTSVERVPGFCFFPSDLVLHPVYLITGILLPCLQTHTKLASMTMISSAFICPRLWDIIKSLINF